MSGSINLTQARDFLTNLLPKAGKITEKYFKSKNLVHKSKGGVDFVTEADLAVDEFLRKELSKKFPGSKFLTEETAPKSFEHLKKEENLWIIDPIDGTSNFSRGDPNFAISVGLVSKGLSKLGVVYAPILKTLYFAQADKTQVKGDNNSIRVSNMNDLGKSSIVFEWAYKPEDKKRTINYLAKVVNKFRQIKSLGSAVLTMVNIAEGRCDAFISCGIKPWDLAAACLIVEKAGGKIISLNKDKFDVFDSDVLVTNGKLQNSILKLIK